MEGILETICSRFIFGYPQAKLWHIGRRCVTTTKDQTRLACEVEVYFGSRFWRVRFKGQVASGNKDPQLGVGGMGGFLPSSSWAHAQSLSTLHNVHLLWCHSLRRVSLLGPSF